ncbi:MAG: radical SAM protein [Sedimenticola sp.]
MKIILLNVVGQALSTRGDSNLENASLAYLGGALKAAGFEFSVVDNVLDGRSPEALVAELPESDNILLAVHLMGRNWVDGLNSFLRAVEEQKHAVRYLVVGGQYASLYADEILADCPAIDMLVRGEGEEILLRIATLMASGEFDALSQLDDKLFYQADLAAIPNPYHYSLAMEVPPSITIWTSRGCIGKCAFCMTPEFHRHFDQYMRRRPCTRVAEEIVSLHDATGRTFFQFGDDNFVPLDKQEQQSITDMLEGIKARIPEFTFSIYAKPDLVDLQLFSHWKTLGLKHTFLGIESFNDTFLRYLGKTNRCTDNLKALEIHNQLSLRYTIGYIMVSPFFEIEDIQGELQMLQQHVLDTPVIPASLFNAPSNCLLVYNKTRLYRKLKAEGVISAEGYDHFYDIYPYRINPTVSIYLQAIKQYTSEVTGSIDMEAAQQALFIAQDLAEAAPLHLMAAQER